MNINTKEELNSCMQNDVPCKYLIGYFTEEQFKKWNPDREYYFPLVSCAWGWECGRGMCARFESN